MGNQVIKSNLNTPLDESSLLEFKSHLHGPLIRPGEPEYDAARKVWNGMIDKHPALIVQPVNGDDVVSAVNFGREHGLLVAVRGGGHNVAGFGTCDGGMVIDLAGMKRIEVNPKEQTARAQGGLTWGEFDQATQAHGLATTGGLVSTTGIAGFTLGGGIGWLMRKYGLAADNLLSAEMVTAQGQRLKVSPKENADLYWGLRGGGGNFGVVTSFEYQLYPVGPTVLGGALFYSLEQAKELLSFYRQWTQTLPEELTSMVVFLTAPPEPFVPQHLVGSKMVAVALCYAGVVEQGQALVKPLRDRIPPAIDLVGPIPYTVLQGMFDASAPRGIRSYWKSEYLSDLPDHFIQVVVDAAGNASSPFNAIHIQHLGGAIRQKSAEETAFTHRDAHYVLNMIGEWMDPGQDAENIGWVRGLWQAVQPFATGAVYLNFMDNNEGEARVRSAYGASKFARLAELKKKYDPTNFFRLNQNIPPGA